MNREPRRKLTRARQLLAPCGTLPDMRKVAILALLLLPIFSFAIERQPNSDYRARREALAKKAGDNGMFLVFAGAEAEGPNAIYGFHQDENYYYLTGLTDPGGAVLIVPAHLTRDGKTLPYSEVLFLPATDRTQEKWTGPKLGPDSSDLKAKTGFDRVVALDRMRDVLMELTPAPVATVYTNKSADDHAFDWLHRTNSFPGFVHVEDGTKTIGDLRAFKDAGEATLIRKAVDNSVAAHFAAMKAMKPGQTEHQIAALMEYEYERRGSERPAYASIVGSGFNSTVLHYAAGPKVIQDGDIVVIDVGGEYSGYASDITRTLPANGHFTPRQREIYNIVLGAQQAAIAAFKSGESVLTGNGPNSLYKVAMDYFNTHGKDSHGQPLGQYFIHGLGHNVGLNVHDPASEKPLAPGSVFTIEPGIYIPDESLGVRIEDDFWVDPTGKLVMLSGALPHTAEDVEKEMQNK
jgi:Xaa-Pro aminopeptidase